MKPAELDSLRPTERRRVYDLLAEAGVDTSEWAEYSGANPAANPKFCYQWAFESEKCTVLNVWHREMLADEAGIYLTGNMRAFAESRATGVRRSRAVLFDRAVQRSVTRALPIRTIICAGPAPQDGRPSRAAFRLLDKVEWYVAAYDDETGQFVLRRGFRDPLDLGSYLPEEVASEDEFREGKATRILVNSYERNFQARRKCLEYYGAICSVCRMEFGQVYGPVAEGYMHVHHLKPLGEIGAEYEVDPIRDLRPICPNCHAVVHAGGACRPLEDVEALMKRLAETNAR